MFSNTGVLSYISLFAVTSITLPSARNKMLVKISVLIHEEVLMDLQTVSRCLMSDIVPLLKSQKFNVVF